MNLFTCLNKWREHEIPTSHSNEFGIKILIDFYEYPPGIKCNGKFKLKPVELIKQDLMKPIRLLPSFLKLKEIGSGIYSYSEGLITFAFCAYILFILLIFIFKFYN